MKHNFKSIILLITWGCANVAMPTGGPRDKTPPELLISNPANNQLNFTGNTIELDFNEDIKLKDPKEEILIVPSIGKKTLFSVKKTNLMIKPELEWQPNTTYSVNFREGVQDLSEGNPAENLRLAFSTGSVIDSLTINGRVKDSFSEKVPEKITIALYQTDTFDIFKHTPTYFTKSTKEGLFSIPNLKATDYFIYAFDDKNKNLKVDSRTEKFGFLTKVIAPDTSRDSLEIPLSMLDSRRLLLTNIRHSDKVSRVRFNKQVDSIRVAGVSKKEAIYTYSDDKSELIFYNTFAKTDSIKTHIIARDSLGQNIDTTFYIRYSEIKALPETFKTKELSANYNVKSKVFRYTLGYNKPIGVVNRDSIYILYDSINTKPIDPKNFNIDTLNHQIIIESIINEITKPEKDKTENPKLILGKGAIISIENDSIKHIEKEIVIQTEEDLGAIIVQAQTAAKNYIIQVITSDNKIVQNISNIKEYTFRYLQPNEYKIRVIIDENNNGKWDVGNFYKKTESEKIIFYKSEDGKYSTQLRAYFEIGPLLIKF